MHKAKCIFVFVVLLLTSVVPSTAFALESCPEDMTYQARLTSDDITARFRSIHESYEVGDVLSEDDAEFVHKYAKADNQIETRLSGSFNQTGSYYGVTANVAGTVWHNAELTGYNFGGNVTGRILSGATPKNMTVTVTCDSFGMVGGETILTYKDKVSQTSYNSKTVTMNKSKFYTAGIVLYTINTTLDVTTADGAGFNIAVS